MEADCAIPRFHGRYDSGLVSGAVPDFETALTFQQTSKHKSVSSAEVLSQLQAKRSQVVATAIAAP